MDMIDEWMRGWLEESWGDEEEKAPPGHRGECQEEDAPIARGLELGSFGLRGGQMELNWSTATPLFAHCLWLLSHCAGVE